MCDETKRTTNSKSKFDPGLGFVICQLISTDERQEVDTCDFYFTFYHLVWTYECLAYEYYIGLFA